MSHTSQNTISMAMRIIINLKVWLYRVKNRFIKSSNFLLTQWALKKKSKIHRKFTLTYR